MIKSKLINQMKNEDAIYIIENILHSSFKDFKTAKKTIKNIADKSFKIEIEAYLSSVYTNNRTKYIGKSKLKL